MKVIWNSITDWFNSKGGWAHGMFALYMMGLGAYDGVPALAQLVNTTYAAMPSWAHQAAGVLIGFILWYTQTSKATPAPPAQPGVVAKGLPVVLLLLLIPALGLSGCTSWERTTFQTLAATKADIDAAQAAYEVSQPTGKCPVPSASVCLPHTQAVYEAIGTAKISQTLAVNQMVAYEQLKATGATASSLQVAESQVVAALSQLPPEITQLKALYTGGQ